MTTRWSSATRVSLIFVTMACLSVLNGCVPAQQSLPGPRTPQPWSETLRKAKVAATSKGASPEQLAVIASGRVTFEDYEKAVRRTISCLESNGVTVVNKDVTRENGFPQILYSYSVSSPGRTDQQTDDVSQSCINTHSLFIEGLYGDSPEVQAAMDRAFEGKRADVVACLKEQGIQVPSDATRRDIEFYATDVLIRTGVVCLVR